VSIEVYLRGNARNLFSFHHTVDFCSHVSSRKPLLRCYNLFETLAIFYALVEPVNVDRSIARKRIDGIRG